MTSRESVQAYARVAGLLFPISFAAGGFGEAYVAGRMIEAGDAAATANNVLYFSASHVLGALFALGGGGFVARSFLVVLAPEYASSLFLLPMVIAALLLTIWLLVKGVDADAWQAKAAAAR